MSDNEILRIPNKRREEALRFWNRVKEDLKSGMTPEQIASTYINKRTGKPYTREHIFWVTRQIKKGLVAQ